ncbi:MAG: YbhB/YbcL family Raf kinase inhibitor-like protein, partial [Candidatus Portnoybacteria bacterium]|nr:YbhB/YbcL family Raf kinase inhibitor-like protein [Candidatus Portnoybacteria bacterium]
MKIQSKAFESNKNIPSKYTCDGEKINPPLEIDNVPEEAKSLVLIMDDPDAPSKTWLHWLVWNVDPRIKEISENSKPKEGIEGGNDSGSIGYTPPCPPSGSHRYFFRLYALDARLDLDQSANRKDIEDAMSDHII